MLSTMMIVNSMVQLLKTMRRPAFNTSTSAVYNIQALVVITADRCEGRPRPPRHACAGRPPAGRTAGSAADAHKLGLLLVVAMMAKVMETTSTRVAS